MNRIAFISGLLMASLWAGGCTGAGRVNLAPRTGGNAALFAQFQAYDGHTGRPLSFSDVVGRCAAADVVLFGEEHSDVVCNQFEAQLLYALAAERRPLALALEFFEADTQAVLDGYLRGRIAEAPFRTEARQGRSYVLSHRPLIELCRAARIPVLAANAPRRLVRAYRLSGLSFDEFRAGLDAADQTWLPTSSAYLSGPYEERFFEQMRGHRMTRLATTAPAATQPASQAATGPASTAPAAEAAASPETQPATAPAMPPVSQPVASMPAGGEPAAFYQAQLLWDEAMASALADFRARFTRHRMLLLVGVFHVAHQGGTVAKFRRRRPQDRVATIVYASTADGRFPFDEEDRHAGDIVVYGIAPPPKEAAEPPSPPATAPVTSEPTSAPATASAPQTEESD